MGNGSGTGLGSGNGSGLGPGSGGNTGGGPRRIGGGVSAPVLIYSVEPEFSEEARKAKVAGNVLVNLWVGTDGLPSHVHVIRGVGMGLDEKAKEAVAFALLARLFVQRVTANVPSATGASGPRILGKLTPGTRFSAAEGSGTRPRP